MVSQRVPVYKPRHPEAGALVVQEEKCEANSFPNSNSGVVVLFMVSSWGGGGTWNGLWDPSPLRRLSSRRPSLAEERSSRSY